MCRTANYAKCSNMNLNIIAKKPESCVLLRLPIVRPYSLFMIFVKTICIFMNSGGYLWTVVQSLALGKFFNLHYKTNRPDVNTLPA